MPNSLSESWITIAGSRQSDIEQLARSRVEAHIAKGDFAAKDVDYVAKLTRPLYDGAVEISAPRLEKLRRMCQLWDVELRPSKIVSHRKFIGPIIVGFKRMLYPILKVLMKEYIKQQREFNAATISLMAEISRESGK